MKVVLNKDYGGFELSQAAKDLFTELSGINVEELRFMENMEQFRTNATLVRVVETLGDDAHARGKLKVVEIPDDILWHISEYDGMEWVAENHRMWS
jgi:hypothetical protein